MKKLIASLALVAGTVLFASPSQAQDNRSCRVTDVSVFADRIHLKCEKPLSGDTTGWGGAIFGIVSFYAIEVGSPLADKFLAVGLAALQSGKTLRVVASNQPANNPPGCLPADCRRILSLRLYN